MTGFFRKASSLAIAAIAASAISAAAANAKYIFYFIGDGMGIPEVTNAQLFNRNVLRNDTPLLMTTFPVVSMITTHSASSDVTDSAAAGTALAAGHKTINGMLGMTPDSVAVTSIAKTLFDNGYGIGLVTSVAIDDATPGAFYTHVPNRNQFYETGRMLAESGYQFFAGASLRGTKDQHGNDNGLVDYIRQNNVSVHYGLDSIDTTADRLLILSPFHETNNNCIGLTVDSIAGALTLPELTRTGLKHLQRVSPDRFFMMVEGGNIDHAGHGNDGGTSMREIINFNDAIRVAYDFYLQHPDETLIVITADHETGGMSVGCQETGYSVQLQNAAMQKGLYWKPSTTIATASINRAWPSPGTTWSNTSPKTSASAPPSAPHPERWKKSNSFSTTCLRNEMPEPTVKHSTPRSTSLPTRCLIF